MDPAARRDRVVAGVTALVVSGAPALGHVTKKLGHIVKHLNPLFVNVGEKVSDSDLLDGKDATEFLGANAKAADAELLDGSDSSDFTRSGETAADSELLDGMDSSDFQPRYDRIVVVSTAAELLSAASSAVSGTLIKVEPGNYNRGPTCCTSPRVWTSRARG